MKRMLFAQKNQVTPPVFQQYEHHPNCSSITADELAETIDGVWPSSDGKAKINFIFSYPAFNWLYDPDNSLFRKRYLGSSLNTIFQNLVRQTLSVIEEKNNGILSFNEVGSSFVTNYNPFAKGIYYVQAATEAQFAEEDEGAFTVLRFDNNGYLKKAIIYMPSDLDLYQNISLTSPPDWILYAISHETYHALGGQHLQNYPDILEKLQNMTDGVFCSVMDYPTIVGTNISNCQQNCTPPFAVYPGPLDVELMQLAYQQGRYDRSFDKIYYYGINALELSIFLFFITIAYSYTDDCLNGIVFRKKRLLNKQIVQALLDLTLLVTLIEMELPLAMLIFYGLSRFHLCLQAIVGTFAEGTLPGPFFLTLALTLVFVSGGIFTGYGLSYLSLLLINRMIKNITNKYFPETLAVPAEVQILEESIVELTEDQAQQEASLDDTIPDDAASVRELSAISPDIVAPPADEKSEQAESKPTLSMNPYILYKRALKIQKASVEPSTELRRVIG
jgi:hypothetical protein